MNLSSKQDALIELHALQTSLEYYRKNAYKTEEIWELYAARIEELFELLELDPQSRIGQLYSNFQLQPGALISWLDSVEGAWTICRMHDAGLPKCMVTLTDNDRRLISLMFELEATSRANPKPADALMSGIGGGDHKKAFVRLKAGGYVLSDPGRGKGWWLTGLGQDEARRLKEQMQNGTL